ncbi:MAG TPA: hypothetical protein VEI26_10765, partial [Terriglobales bacterium]|nr:hypothetical protein [Terriglobales bacterium]
MAERIPLLRMEPETVCVLLAKFSPSAGKPAKMRTGKGVLFRMILLVALPWGRVIQAQESLHEQKSGIDFSQEETEVNQAAPCLEPAPIIDWEEYQGKFKKSVGVFARKLERKSVPRAHYKAGALL